MLSLIGTGLVFFTSFLPKVMDYFQDKQDKAHELRVMAQQIAAQKDIEEIKLDMSHIDAQIRETEALHRDHAAITVRADQWVINLAASVRPVMTYLLFIEFFVLTIAVFMKWIDATAYAMVWNQEIQAVWSAVIAFWFGQRTFGRKS